MKLGLGVKNTYLLSKYIYFDNINKIVSFRSLTSKISPLRKYNNKNFEKIIKKYSYTQNNKIHKRQLYIRT